MQTHKDGSVSRNLVHAILFVEVKRSMIGWTQSKVHGFYATLNERTYKNVHHPAAIAALGDGEQIDMQMGRIVDRKTR